MEKALHQRKRGKKKKASGPGPQLRLEKPQRWGRAMRIASPGAPCRPGGGFHSHFHNDSTTAHMPQPTRRRRHRPIQPAQSTGPINRTPPPVIWPQVSLECVSVSEMAGRAPPRHFHTHFPPLINVVTVSVHYAICREEYEECGGYNMGSVLLFLIYWTLKRWTMRRNSVAFNHTSNQWNWTKMKLTTYFQERKKTKTITRVDNMKRVLASIFSVCEIFKCETILQTWADEIDDATPGSLVPGLDLTLIFSTHYCRKSWDWLLHSQRRARGTLWIQYGLCNANNGKETTTTTTTTTKKPAGYAYGGHATAAGFHLHFPPRINAARIEIYHTMNRTEHEECSEFHTDSPSPFIFQISDCEKRRNMRRNGAHLTFRRCRFLQKWVERGLQFSWSHHPVLFNTAECNQASVSTNAGTKEQPQPTKNKKTAIKKKK